MPAPKGVRFPVSSTLKIQKALWEHIKNTFRDRFGEMFQDELLEIFKHEVSENFGLREYVFRTESDPDEIRDEATEIEEWVSQRFSKIPPFTQLLSWWYGKQFTEMAAFQLCWRVSAGFTWMAENRELQREFVEHPPLWAGLHIDSMHFGTPSKRTNVPQMSVQLRIMDGPFGGLVIRQLMPYTWIVSKLAKSIGFPMYERQHPFELVQCVFLGRLDLSNPRFPRVDEFDTSSGTLTHNRRIRKLRGEACVNDWRVACHNCHLGYLNRSDHFVGSCYRATHPRTYVDQLCRVCNREARFDLELNRNACLNCLAKAAKFRADLQHR